MRPDLQLYALLKPTDECRHFAHPFTLVGTKRTIWNVASDRAHLVALRGEAHFKRWQGSGGDLTAMLQYIQAKPKGLQEVEVTRLLDWIGNPKKDELGRICGAPLTLYRVVKLLKLVTTEKVGIWDASSLAWNQPCLGMRAGDMRAMLMGNDPKKIDPVEREFDAEGPSGEMNAFDLAMSLGGG